MARVNTNSIRITEYFQQTFKNVNEIEILNFDTESIFVNHKNVIFEIPGASIINKVLVPTIPFIINALGNEIDEVKIEITFPNLTGNAVVNSSQFIKC